jgi:flagellar hook-basal body complex protein FliE
VISPLEAFSALTQSAAPLTSGASMPAGMTNGVSGSFQLPAMDSTQATSPTGISEGFQMPQITTPTIATPTVNSLQGPSTWGHMVQQMVMDVNSKQQSATAMVTDVLKGGPTPVHEAMIASEEASLSFEMVAEMRNKIVDAYNQVMQMQV